MSISRKDLQENLSAQLRNRLRLFFQGRIPSAAAFARQFNLRASEPGVAVSQETARRWLRGKSFPGEIRLGILTQWLSLDLQSTFSQQQSAVKSKGVSLLQNELIELVSKTDSAHQLALLNLLKATIVRSHNN